MKLALLLLTAGLGMAQSVTVTWPVAPANPTTGVGYNVWRAPVVAPATTCPAAGAVYTKITSAIVNALTYTDTTVAPGSQYCYRGTAIKLDGTAESAMSVPSSIAVIPLSAPPSMNITVSVAVNLDVNVKLAGKDVTATVVGQ